MPMHTMPTNLEKNPPAVEDNTEELVLKTEVLEQKPAEEPTQGANIETICRELEQKIAKQYVSSDAVKKLVDTQIKSFFADNVVVRGKTPPKQSELTEHLADIKQRIKDKT